MALPPLFSLKKSCESPADPRNNQKPHILHEIGWIPMSSLVHCGIAGRLVVPLISSSDTPRIELIHDGRPPDEKPSAAQRIAAGLSCFWDPIRSTGEMMIDRAISEGLTFDDVLLLPGKSSILPAQADTRTCISRKIALHIPIVAAAMDTVTDSRLAIAIARQGGIGFIHRNMSIERQAEEVDRVKRSESGMIVDPVTIGPEMSVRQALDIMNKYKVSGLPVTRGSRLVGILTNRDLR